MDGIQGFFVPVDMFPDRVEKRIVAIFFHQIPVKFNFHDKVVVAGFLSLLIYIGVAFTVQHEMADETKQIGILSAVFSFLLNNRTNMVKKISEGLPVLGVAQSVRFTVYERSVEEQKVRSLQPGIESPGVFADNLL